MIKSHCVTNLLLIALNESSVETVLICFIARLHAHQDEIHTAPGSNNLYENIYLIYWRYGNPIPWTVPATIRGYASEMT